MTSPTKTGQGVGSDLQAGDRVIYWRAGDFGLPMTQHPAVYLRTTKSGRCVIMIDNRSRTTCVRRISIVKVSA